MVNWLKNLFKTNEGGNSEQGISDLKKVWEGLDSKLQACAIESFQFGRKKDFMLKLNQVGMVQLIQHLDRHGFEIKRKKRP
jgi:hypothetical protein